MATWRSPASPAPARRCGWISSRRAVPTTGKLLPTGKSGGPLDVPGVGTIAASMVDAANAGVFVRAADLGLTGTELPEQLDADTALLARLQAIRQCAAVAMGIARDTMRRRATIARRADDRLRCAAGGCADSDRRDDRARRCRSDRAVPVERSAASRAAADRLAVHRGRRAHRRHAGGRGAGAGSRARTIRIGMPSGILTVGAEVSRDGPASGSRTAARSTAPRGGCLMGGSICLGRTNPVGG